MFCPVCGEKNSDISTCCTKCGLNLTQIRIIIAEGNHDYSDTERVGTPADESVKSTDSGLVTTVSDDPPPGDVTTPMSGETASFDSADPVQLKDRGNELFREEKYLDALDCYEKALAIDQFYKEAWFNKSMVLKKIGRQDQSKVCWGIYQRLSSGDPEAQKK
jgi:tetratricopeptide (TPR) repeat protein